MRRTLPRLIAIIPRDAVPKHAQTRIIPPLPRPSEQAPQPNLVDLLIARREENERILAEAQEKGKLEGEGELPKPWPTNLRIEPVVKREQLSQIHRSVRMQVKEALKER